MYSKCGVAPSNQAAETDDRGDAPGLGDALRRNRNLEGAGHAQHLDVVVADAGLAQRLLRAGRAGAR